MTIADKLTRLATAHDAIISAINAKGGSATGDGFEDFATDIAAIPTGGGVHIDTAEVTVPSGYPSSISFTDLKGEPQMFVVRQKETSISSSGSTTYYYVIAVVYDGDTTVGNYFRIGSTRTVYPATSGYSWTYNNGTLTVTSSALARNAVPGAFYTNIKYELIYVY